MANTDYEHRSTQDYIDNNPTRHDASSGVGMVIGLVALVAILAMLFIGFGSGPRDGTVTNTPAIERTVPPAQTGPTTQPAPTPTPAPNPN